MNDKYKKKLKSNRFGKYAETITAIYLRLKFYQIIERNYKTKVGEIDIIAKKGNMLVIVEVKARKSSQNNFEVLSKNQQIRIVNATRYFVMSNSKFANCGVRFDLVKFVPLFGIKHLKNAWQT